MLIIKVVTVAQGRPATASPSPLFEPEASQLAAHAQADDIRGVSEDEDAEEEDEDPIARWRRGHRG